MSYLSALKNLYTLGITALWVIQIMMALALVKRLPCYQGFRASPLPALSRRQIFPSMPRSTLYPSRFGDRFIHAATTRKQRSIAMFSTTSKIETATTMDNSNETLYQQFKDLSIQIRKHDELYYSGGINLAASDLAPISDDEFDALVRKEEEFEENYPLFLSAWRDESGLGVSATRSGRVGTKGGEDAAVNSSLRTKRTHLSPMLSLDNVHNEDQLHVWLRRVVKATNDLEIENEREGSTSLTIVTEPKLDGLGLSLRYEASSDVVVTNDGGMVVLDLQWASTRGDGKVGQDVTPAAHQMAGIPARIQLPLTSGAKAAALDNGSLAVEVRGEVVLPRSEFLRLQRDAEIAAAAAARLQDESQSEEETKQNSGDSDSTGDETTPPKDNSPKTFSFSNPRNAASGILLRKESDDPNEQSEARGLRSLLRFYAYDVTGLERFEEGEIAEINGIRIRQYLSDWKFSLALPATITEIQWDRDDIDATVETVVDSEDTDEPKEAASSSWDDWFREAIVADQIQPIMEYFSALEEHRQRLQQQENNSPAEASTKSKTKRTKKSSRYEWGDFDVDGCVHKVSQGSIKAAMGYSMKSPKWATAHKFPAQSAVARLLDIIVQVGRTGALTPVAILEPTEVGGVTVQRATLHNFGHLNEILGGNNVDNGGDEESTATSLGRIPKYEPVLLQRAGDVIPQVVRRIHNSRPESSSKDDDSSWISVAPPECCPFCQSPVTYETTGSSSVGQVIRCSGPPLLCPPRAVMSLKHAFSRDALDFAGLSESRIQQLMDAGLLRTPSDVFQMGDEEWEKVAGLPGWGKRSCTNLRQTSERIASNGMTLNRFIYSLGIRHVGKHSSELLAASYGSIGAFLEALDAAADYREPIVDNDNEEGDPAIKGESTDEPSKQQPENRHPFPELENKLGIGPVIIESLLAFARTKDLTDATKEIAKSLTIMEDEVVMDDDNDDEPSDSGSDESSSANRRPWKGFRVVFTGTLSDGLTRSKAQEIAKQLGAKATPGSVSKSTDLVVFGDKGGKKLTQARDLGISTMEADDFVRLAKEKGYL